MNLPRDVDRAVMGEGGRDLWATTQRRVEIDGIFLNFFFNTSWSVSDNESKRFAYDFVTSE